MAGRAAWPLLEKFSQGVHRICAKLHQSDYTLFCTKAIFGRWTLGLAQFFADRVNAAMETRHSSRVDILQANGDLFSSSNGKVRCWIIWHRFWFSAVGGNVGNLRKFLSAPGLLPYHSLFICHLAPYTQASAHPARVETQTPGECGSDHRPSRFLRWHVSFDVWMPGCC